MTRISQDLSDGRCQDVTDIDATHEQRLDGSIVEFLFVLYLTQKDCDIAIHEEAFFLILDRESQLLYAFGVRYSHGSIFVENQARKRTWPETAFGLPVRDPDFSVDCHFVDLLHGEDQTLWSLLACPISCCRQ